MVVENGLGKLCFKVAGMNSYGTAIPQQSGMVSRYTGPFHLLCNFLSS